MENCLFCRIAGKKIPAAVVYEDDEMIAFRDIAPKAPLHAVFIPKKHIETLNDISKEDAPLLGRMMAAAKDTAAREGFSEKGYRIVVNCNKDAGQEVFHVHMHLMAGRKFMWPPG
jgi:histidine triad (HIT) family protein